MSGPDPTRAHHHPDPVIDAIVWHQRKDIGGCLCGWSVLGASWAEHVAGIVRPLIGAEVRASAGAIARYYADPFEGKPGDSTYTILRHVAACIESGETVESIDPQYADRIARGAQ